MKNSVLFSISKEEVTWGYPFSLFMHYGLNRLVLGFNTLLLIRHGIARGRKQLEEKAKIQTSCIAVHRTLLTAQLDLPLPLTAQETLLVSGIPWRWHRRKTLTLTIWARWGEQWVRFPHVNHCPPFALQLWMGLVPNWPSSPRVLQQSSHLLPAPHCP